MEITQKGVKESKSRIEKFIDEISNPFCLTMIAAAVVCLVIICYLYWIRATNQSSVSGKREERKIVMNNKRLIEIDVRRLLEALKTHLS